MTAMWTEKPTIGRVSLIALLAAIGMSASILNVQAAGENYERYWYGQNNGGCIKFQIHWRGYGETVLQHANGTVLTLNKDVQDGSKFVRVWVNGQYAGEIYPPTSILEGTIEFETYGGSNLGPDASGRVRVKGTTSIYGIACDGWVEID